MVGTPGTQRGLALLVGLLLGVPELAYAINFVTKTETVVGRNGRHDVSPSGCDVSLGCFTDTGGRCADNPDDRCNIQITPLGRCTQGTGSCLWPQGAGFCQHDGGGTPVDPVACLSDDYVQFLKTGGPRPTGNGPSIMCMDAIGSNGTCDMSTNDPSCDCNGTDQSADPSNTNDDVPSWEGVVCGPGSIHAVCSDGDPDRNLAGWGLSLCIQLCVEPTCTPDASCGSVHTFEGAVVGSKYPNGENWSDVFTLQRRPGEGATTPDQGGPIQTGASINAVFVDGVGEGSWAAYGVRQYRTLTNGHHADETFTSSEVNGTVDDTGPTAFTCEIPEAAGWSSGLPIDGRCQLTPGTFCIQDLDCGAGFCDPATFEYCQQGDSDFATVSDLHYDSTGFGWTRSLTPTEIAAQDGVCPPDCRSGYDFDLFEEEGFTQAVFDSGDLRIGFQVVFEDLEGPRMATGQSIYTAAVQSINALVLGDNRCYIGGNPFRDDPNDGNIGRCLNSGDSCDPRLAVGGNGCPGADSCLYCHGTADTSAAPHASNVEFATFGGNYGFDPINGNPEALPIGYQTHGVEAADIRGRIGRLNGAESNLETKLLLILTSGPANATFADNTCAGAGTDKCDLGQVNGGWAGLGPDFRYYNAGDPIPHDPSFSFLESWTVPPYNPGTPQGIQIGVTDYGAGADGIPGCMGDNNNGAGGGGSDEVTCTEPLGDANTFGSTGTDDTVIEYDYSIAGDGSDMRNGTQGKFPIQLEPFAFTAPRTYSVATSGRDLASIGNTDGLDYVGKIDITFCAVVNRVEKTLTFNIACLDSDLDQDGWLDQQDGCPLNPTLAMGPDNGGVASASDPGGFLPDGILDACQCGDVSDDGRVSGTDATAITRACLGLAPYTATGGCQTTQTSPTPFIVEKCDVGGPFADGVCSGTDGSLVKRGTLGLPPGLDLTCTAYLP